MPPPSQQQQSHTGTACLRPTVAPGRVGAALALACLSAILGGALTAHAIQGNPPSQPTARLDPSDAESPESRLRSAAGYMKRWHAKADSDGTAHIRYEELRSCYNLMTGEVLPFHDDPSARGPVQHPSAFAP